MPSQLSLMGAGVLLAALATAPALAEDVGQYREFSLGSSLASVLELTQGRTSDVRTVHERPSLLQAYVWRPRYSAGRPLPDVDPVREMSFSFVDDQLYQIAISYDRERTAGLTQDDLILALTEIYGPPVSRDGGPPLVLSELVDARALLATWEDGDTFVSLFWSDYRAAHGLVVISKSRQDTARLARTASVALDEREAPMREAARLKKEAEDRKSQEERSRATNKGAFRP